MNSMRQFHSTPQPTPILIAVLGVTGAGKTTFISKATGRNDLMIGSGLKSCTQDISASTVQVSGEVVTLIDTPGFDDTERSDADILESISVYLLETYARKILLTGIILLQPITGNRVKGSEKRRLRLFEKILGEAAFSHVVIATTMWSELNNNVDGESRVTERMSDYWGDLLRGGAMVAEHDNTREGAIGIIELLVGKGTVTLRMQEELEESDGRVMGTAAGQQLVYDLGDDRKKLLAMIERLRRQLQGEKEMREELEEEIREGQAEYEGLEEQELQIKNKRVFLSETLPKWLGAICIAGGAAAINLGFCQVS